MNLFINKNCVQQKYFNVRIFIAALIIIILTCILLIKIYFLQILHFKEYNEKSKDNYIKKILIYPSRGIIYDRNGIPLALNRMIYQVRLIPQNINNVNQLLNKLKPIIDLTDNDIFFFKKRQQIFGDITSIEIKDNLNNLQRARLAVNKYLFPDIKIKTYCRRYYPYGKTLAHVLGYTTKISSPAIEKSRAPAQFNFTGYAEIGKVGIENYYNKVLCGKNGYKSIEINNDGWIIKKLDQTDPVLGSDIWLTIDIKLQQYITELVKNNRASIIVSNPNNGEIFALVSNPSYDPNIFSQGFSVQQYYSLVTDHNQPFLNRVIQAIYPPASTVKPYIAVSALKENIINTSSKIFDPGWWQLPGSNTIYHDWKKSGHGNIDIIQALEQSCDTFFYQIAYDMGINKLSSWMKNFGYGRSTGIDLPSENIGNMPTKKWKINHFHQKWYIGDTIPLGIGQGYWSATPIQIHKSLITLINNGVVKTPHLLKSIIINNINNPYKKKYEPPITNIPSTYWNIAKQGMYRVANNIQGTAYQYLHDAPYKIAAKSGTAQILSLKSAQKYRNNYPMKLRDHILMNAFAPYDKPEVAITVILENGTVGNQKIGKIVRHILDYLMFQS